MLALAIVEQVHVELAPRDVTGVALHTLQGGEGGGGVGGCRGSRGDGKAEERRAEDRWAGIKPMKGVLRQMKQTNESAFYGI